MALLFKRMISYVNSSQTKSREGKGRTLVCFASSSGDQRRRKIGQTKTWPEIGPGATALLWKVGSTWQKEKTSFTLIFNSSFFCTNVLQKWFVFSNKIENKKTGAQKPVLMYFCQKRRTCAFSHLFLIFIKSYKWKVVTRPMNILAAKNNDRTRK